jgi:hypothetical protein
MVHQKTMIPHQQLFTTSWSTVPWPLSKQDAAFFITSITLGRSFVFGEWLPE